MGQRQSPIDIVTSEVRYQEYRPFHLAGYEKLSLKQDSLTIKNTGTTLKMYAGGDEPATLSGIETYSKHKNIKKKYFLFNNDF